MDSWISVKDRLLDKELAEYRKMFPDDIISGVEVIVMISGATLSTVLLYDGESFSENCVIYNVTHWQPLPKPPKGNKANG